MYKSAQASENEERFPEWEDANFLKKFSFSVPNRMLQTGQRRELLYDDLTSQPKSDFVKELLVPLRKNWKEGRSFWFLPRLMVALIRSFPGTLSIVMAGTILEGCVKILKPVMLMLFLQAISDESGATGGSDK